MKLKKGVMILSFLLLIIPIVNGFGITSMYWDTNPLVLEPGQTIDVFLLLQNMVGDSDITLRAEMVEGSDIAKIIDSNLDYLVPFGSKDVRVNIRITIPEDIPLDNEQIVTVSFKNIVPNEARVMQLTSAITKSIPVKIVGSGEGTKTPAEPTIKVVVPDVVESVEGAPVQGSYVLVGIFLMVLILIFFVLKRRNSKKVKIYKRKK